MDEQQKDYPDWRGGPRRELGRSPPTLGRAIRLDQRPPGRRLPWSRSNRNTLHMVALFFSQPCVCSSS
jgi:hypothetical protein